MPRLFRVAVTAVFFLCVVAVLPAAANMPCGPKAAIMASIKGKYGETRTHRAMSPDGKLMFEVWVSASRNSFTMTVINASHPNVMCVVAAGRDWQRVGAPGEDA